MKKVAINGFGRIGRLVFKELMAIDDIVEVIAINDLSTPKELAYLLKYDTVHGRYSDEPKVDGDYLVIGSHRIKILSERDASLLPWEDMEIDVVVECTGVYTKYEEAKKHVEAGARCVIISAPGKGEMKTIVYGVNENTIDGNEQVLSAASCTTNCLAPVLKVLDDNFGVKMGFMTTVHAYTNDQVNLDVQHKKGYMTRRGRACALNMIPTSTGAGTAIDKVIPALKGKISGSAIRVPIGDGSMIDLSLCLKKEVTAEKINDLFRQNANETLEYTEDPIVSSDIVGSKCGALIDGLLTDVISSENGQLVKVVAWYDNELGYSCQLVRTLKYYLKLQK